MARKTEKNKFESAMRADNNAVDTWLGTWVQSIKDYKNLTASWSWHMWQQAKLDMKLNFVLLPADTAHEVLKWAAEAKWNSPDKNADKKIEHHLRILKRAIKVREQSHAN